MGVVLDIILVILIILGVYLGVKKGLIKGVVSLIGLIAIIIISYSLRIPLANFLIDKLPFFKFGGALAGLTSLNILVYNLIAFVVIFVVLYCILNVIISITGFIDTLLKFTVVWVIPSKIGGGIVGFLETWLFLFLILFVLVQINFTSGMVQKSKIADIMLNHTPLIGDFLGGATRAAKEIYTKIDEYKGRTDDNKTTELNLYILQTEINYGLVSKDKAQELMDIGKIGLDNVMFGKGNNLWLNI